MSIKLLWRGRLGVELGADLGALELELMVTPLIMQNGLKCVLKLALDCCIRYWTTTV